MKHQTIAALICALMILITAASASAAYTATFTKPLTTETISGTYAFTVTLAGSDGTYNQTNVTFKTSTGTLLCADTTISATGNDTATCNYATTGLTDGTYNFVALVYNGSDGTNPINGTVASVVVDNTAPTSTFVVDYENHKKFRDLQYSCIGADAIDTSVTYAVNITDLDGLARQNLTSGTSYYNGDNFDKSGDYTAMCRVTDNAGNTVTKTITVSVTSDRTTATTATTSIDQPGKKTNSTTLLVAAAVIVIIAIVVMMSQGGKIARRHHKKKSHR